MSPEAEAIERLLRTRGREFVLTMFAPAHVSEADLVRVIWGHPVAPDVMSRIQATLKERLTAT